MSGAQLTLRFGATRLRAGVYWPRTASASLTLALNDEIAPDDALIGDSLVVALPGPLPRTEQLAAVRWLADHAGELGARPDRLIVAGGAGAARLALAIRDSGWPALHRQVLVHLRFSGEPPMPKELAGLAPATVVHSGDCRDDGARYAAMLRAGGVAVEEIRR